MAPPTQLPHGDSRNVPTTRARLVLLRYVIALGFALLLALVAGVTVFVKHSDGEFEDRTLSSGFYPTAIPGLLIKPADLDLGNVTAESIAVGTISLVNVGRGMINFQSVSSDCGCTTGQLDAQSVAPGGSVEVQVSFNAGWGPARPFSHRLFIPVVTPTSSGVPCRVHGMIVLPNSVFPFPSRVDFGDHCAGEELMADLFVRAAPDVLMRLPTHIQLNHSKPVVVEFEPCTRDCAVLLEKKITLRVRLASPEDVFTEIRFCSAKNPENAPVVVPVHIKATKPIVASPSQLLFLEDQASKATQPLHLESPNGSDLTIDRISASAPMTFQVVPSPRPDQSCILCTLDDPILEPRAADITIECSSPRSIIKVPVVFVSAMNMPRTSRQSLRRP